MSGHAGHASTGPGFAAAVADTLRGRFTADFTRDPKAGRVTLHDAERQVVGVDTEHALITCWNHRELTAAVEALEEAIADAAAARFGTKRTQAVVWATHAGRTEREVLQVLADVERAGGHPLPPVALLRPRYQGMLGPGKWRGTLCAMFATVASLSSFEGYGPLIANLASGDSVSALRNAEVLDALDALCPVEARPGLHCERGAAPMQLARGWARFGAQWQLGRFLAAAEPDVAVWRRLADDEVGSRLASVAPASAELVDVSASVAAG